MRGGVGMSWLDDVRQGRDEIRADMPPQIRHAMDEIIEHIVSELGESPEAWRGCKVTIDWMLNRPISTFIDRDGDDNELFMTMVMLVLGQFLSDERVLAAYKILRQQEQQQKENNHD